MIDHDQIFYDIHLFLNHGKKVAEEINRVFGWSVTVEYGETNPNDNDDNTDGDNND